ncbi:hypothetical protein MASR2M69_11020 [Bacteroidota bacterium]
MALIITLIILGIVLIAIELLIIPGFGFAGVLGLLSIIGAVILSFTTYGQVTGLIVLGSVILLLSLCTWLVLRSKTWRKLTLRRVSALRLTFSLRKKVWQPVHPELP